MAELKIKLIGDREQTIRRITYFFNVGVRKNGNPKEVILVGTPDVIGQIEEISNFRIIKEK